MISRSSPTPCLPALSSALLRVFVLGLPFAAGLGARTVLAQAPPSPPSDGYVVYDTERRASVDLGGLVARLDDADVVFFGETHDDRLAHALEDSVYALLLERRGDVTLSLEMLETDVQPIVDEYLAGLIDEDRLESDARVWGNHRVAYQPMVARARAAEQPVVAANAAQRYVRLVGQRGVAAIDQLPPASRAYLPPYPWRFVDTAYRARFWGLMGGMSGHGANGGDLPAGHPPIGDGDDDLNPFFAAQQLWDATMAHNISQASTEHKGPIYHVTGSFHVEYRQGTVSQLLSLRPSLRTAIVIVAAPDEDILGGRTPTTDADWATLAERADFLVVHEP